MRDLLDAELREVERVKALGAAIVMGFVLLAGYNDMGGWWITALLIAGLTITMLVAGYIERKYDRIRIENNFRNDEEIYGLGWDSKEEAQAHLVLMPHCIRETHCVMRYFNKGELERWGVCKKPKYWRNADAEKKVWDSFPPTPEEKEMIEQARSRLISEARNISY